MVGDVSPWQVWFEFFRSSALLIRVIGFGFHSGNYPILAIPAKPSLPPYLGIPPHPRSSQNGVGFEVHP
jgi:hypothetical protein